MSRWLGRLAFSFLILAALCAYEGRKVEQRGKSATLHYAGAAVLGALGILGVRERHRRDG